MSTTKTNIKVTMVYLDAETRDYTLQDVETPDITTVKQKIAAFNGAASTGTSDVNKTFISNNGASVTMIREAQIIQTTEEVIYNAS